MAKLKIPPKLSIALAIIAFAIAAISFFGIILKNDLVGRLIFGATWTFLGVVWLGQFFQAKRDVP